MKKQCNPILGNKKKSFKERNPDLDMDEIQNNPNIPDDVKAVLNGALTLDVEDEYDDDLDDGNAPELPAQVVESCDVDNIWKFDFLESGK